MKEFSKKFFIYILTLTLLVGTFTCVTTGSVRKADDFDGDVMDNPWGALFSTTTAKESKTTRKETTTETVTESGTTTEATTSDNTSDSAGITTEEKNTGDNATGSDDNT